MEGFARVQVDIVDSLGFRKNLLQADFVPNALDAMVLNQRILGINVAILVKRSLALSLPISLVRLSSRQAQCPVKRMNIESIGSD